MIIKEQFEALLRELGVSARQFSIITKVSQPAIAQIMLGRNSPSLSVIQKILAAFPQINTEWLVLGQGDMLKQNTDTQLSLPVSHNNSLMDSENNVVVNNVADDDTASMNAVKNDSVAAHQETQNLAINNVTNTIAATETAETTCPQDNDSIYSNTLNSISKPQEIERVMIFYKDKRVVAYTPE